MSTYLKYENKTYTLPSDCSLSVGNSCDTRDKRMSDGSATSYSITTFTKPQVNTYSVTFNLSLREYPQLVEELYKLENLVGKNVSFTYCEIPFGQCMVNDLSVSFALDATVGIVGLAITINLQDNAVITAKAAAINTRFE